MNDGSPLQTFLRVLSYHVPLGTWMGISVRLHWMTIFIPLYLMQRGFPFAAALAVTVLLYLVVFTHELGHILAAWRCRVPANEISLSPLGGLAHMQEPASSPKDDIFISLAGPATHLGWLAVTALLQLVIPDEAMRLAGVPLDVIFFDMNLWLMIFNLLPFFPMDGGRIFGAALSLRMDHGRAQLIMLKTGMAGAALFMLASFLETRFGSSLLFILGISNMLVCYQMYRWVQMMGPMAYRRREVWEMDADSWKRGADPFGSAEKKPGFLARRREQRDRDAHNRAIALAEEMERELDDILEKVHRDGLPSLTKREKKVLEQASERRRKNR